VRNTRVGGGAFSNDNGAEGASLIASTGTAGASDEGEASGFSLLRREGSLLVRGSGGNGARLSAVTAVVSAAARSPEVAGIPGIGGGLVRDAVRVGAGGVTVVDAETAGIIGWAGGVDSTVGAAIVGDTATGGATIGSLTAGVAAGRVIANTPVGCEPSRFLRGGSGGSRRLQAAQVIDSSMFSALQNGQKRITR
jgi:hypothetical protein